MSKYRFDQHMDAPSALFFARQLEYIRPKIFEKKFPEFKARKFLPINNEVNSGAETITVRSMEEFGAAKLASALSGAAPRVDLAATESSQHFRSITAAYGWSIQEARAAMMAGLPLDMKKANAARKVIEQKIDEVLLVGDTAMGLTGLFNLSGTMTYSTPNGALGSKAWTSKTPLEVVKDLSTMVIQMAEDSKDQEIPDSLLLPIQRLAYIKNTKMGDGESVSILNHFLANNPNISYVDSSWRLTTAGGSSSNRAVLYRRDPEALEGLISQEFEQLPPQFLNYEVLTNCHARVGGVGLYLPNSVMYADNI